MRREALLPFLELRGGGLGLQFLALLDERIDDVGLPPGLELLAAEFRDLGQLRGARARR